MERFILALKLMIALIVIVLFIQNIRVVDINFLAWSLSLPLALLIVAVYVLGMWTGKSLWSVIRRVFGHSSAR
ncbi:DUF1049 domain-containing protein [Aidingimonas halophila]|uniref:Lipopolysaccharide assembly protein A domain-containing protein n=1 Tax=Aidingimonas halophila TaxID=574349 RepID=A0A1H3GGQ8_9GAMM|nr:DUF1049 domain-containing protein [Aidingimonas halophila]GHC33228.1 hypothetical protein GCM10008094_27550 [Aidingimonas halophila]SDY02471.1 Protein of unknown function [Aidingimonas halophila]